MTWIIIAIIAVLVAYRLLHDKRETKHSSWRFDPWTRGVRLDTSSGKPAFDFPATGQGVGYLQWRNPPTPTGRITARFKVEGGGFVPREFPERQATVTLVLQRRGDDWSAEGKMQAYRWYSRQVVDLKAGEFTLSVPLEVSAWGDVNGGQDAAAFAATLRDLDNIAIAFGSAGGRGHGVVGQGRFVLVSLRLVSPSE